MSERSAVQKPMLRYAQEIGWDYVEPEQALIRRSGEAGLYFKDVLETQLLRLNSAVVDASCLPDILRRLNLLRPQQLDITLRFLNLTQLLACDIVPSPFARASRLVVPHSAMQFDPQQSRKAHSSTMNACAFCSAK
jgi:hypothetical protein